MRQRMPLAIGRGMDRSTGSVAVQPNTASDTRNVYSRDAKMVVRRGMALTGYPNLPWGTDTLAIVAVKATLDVLFVIYDRDTKELRIYRLEPTSGVIQTLAAFGLWGIYAGTAFPVVSYAESNGLVFFAHDEADYDVRLPTIYYTPNFADETQPGTLTVLEADLDDDTTPAPVYFRGVYAHLEYIFGWGYGSESEADRPDIIRHSVAGEPLRWLSENNSPCGAQRDPILGCVAVAGMALMEGTAANVPAILAIMKADESYRLIGDNPTNFGIELLDGLYGTVSSRASVNVGGVAYTWSSDGPRLVTPVGIKSYAQPLDLGSPLPADFPTLGPERLVFTAFDQEARSLTWFWTDPERGTVPTPGFTVSLWNPDDPRWTFSLYEQLLTCAGRQIYRDIGGPAVPPTGYPSTIVADDPT